MFRLTVATVFVLLLSAGAAIAQSGVGLCGPYDKMTAVAKHFDERLRFQGIMRDPPLMTQVWAGEKGGEQTFTIFVVEPDGATCTVAVGQDWRFRDGKDN